MAPPCLNTRNTKWFTYISLSILFAKKLRRKTVILPLCKKIFDTIIFPRPGMVNYEEFLGSFQKQKTRHKKRIPPQFDYFCSKEERFLKTKIFRRKKVTTLPRQQKFSGTKNGYTTFFSVLEDHTTKTIENRHPQL